MATSRLMPLHTGKGRTVGQAISDILDYTENPQKTDGGRLITSWQCDSRIADAEFLFTKNQYIQKTGRVRGEDDVIAYHLRQSFVPGEITPEDANRLGCELAKRFTKGNHAYIVCTHIDKAHIHNHVIWNSTALSQTRKFRNFWGSSRAVRRLNDTICIENGYSIVENNGAGKSTFSRCFCGLEKRCGEVIWNGRTYRPKDRLNTCYMVMQEVNHQLFTETVLDEVLISMEEENQEWAEEILAELDLIGFKDRHPMSLSGGQKQRVAIASAIASKRSILFFDEPTSGLDYKHMKEVANVLKQVRDAGITLYVITHDLELLLDCCTDIVHFEDGSIIDNFQMDEAGLEKIRNYFIKGVPTK